jgi:MATE family multidrug resistance protein
LVFAYAYLFFEGVRWVLSGLLVAAGDTLFLLIAGSLSVWVLLLAPIYLIVVRHRLPVEYAWGITIVYSMLLFSIYWIRFKRGAWKKIDLVSPAEPLPEERAVEEAAQAEAPEI